MRHNILAITALLLLAACSAPETYGPVPTDTQLEWQRMEINMFCHFGPNTFSGAEWGDGAEAEDLFRPRALDCRQWVDVASQAGMGGIILTAKHHDGFCLWPSNLSSHTVAQSSWNEGHGDVLRELRTAIDEHNAARPLSLTATQPLLMGVYISPWDRNHPAYGTDAYNDVFDSTLREVHTEYGPLFEQWFDGACGEGPNGKRQTYDWPRFMQTMSELNAKCVVFSDIGPGCRWVGNEEGRAGDPCWSTLCTDGATPSENKPAPAELETGHSPSTFHSPLSTLKWIPAECDVSIRPGWFWHPNEHPKTVDELMEIYFNSVGRNGLMLLNVPPDTNGRIDPADSAVLVAFRKERERIFANDLTQGAKAFDNIDFREKYKRRLFGKKRRRNAPSNVFDTAYNTYWQAEIEKDTLYITLDDTHTFDIIMLQEYLPLGQRVAAFHVECKQVEEIDESSWIINWPTFAEGTTIGYKRLLRIEPVTARRLHIVFDSALAPPAITRIAIYNSKAQ